MRVLLIEDDASTAKSIEMILKSDGYICDTTDLGEVGLEIGKIYDQDLIVLDLMLPDIDGYEVLRRLRAAKVVTPILIHDDPQPAGERQLLINLSASVPLYFAQFERVIELVTEDNKAQARENYSFYKERGYPLKHVNL